MNLLVLAVFSVVVVLVVLTVVVDVLLSILKTIPETFCYRRILTEQPTNISFYARVKHCPFSQGQEEVCSDHNSMTTRSSGYRKSACSRVLSQKTYAGQKSHSSESKGREGRQPPKFGTQKLRGLRALTDGTHARPPSTWRSLHTSTCRKRFASEECPRHPSVRGRRGGEGGQVGGVPEILLL